LDTLVDENESICCPIAPEQFELPVILESNRGHTLLEANPSNILQAIHEWIPESIPNVPLLETTKQMLQNSAENQGENINSDAPLTSSFTDIPGSEKWLRFHHQQIPCDLNSEAIEWERTVIFGHPEHPVRLSLFLSFLQISEL
jgi:hypothetical protein